MGKSNRISGGLSPLGYMGTNAPTPPNTTIVDRAPTTTDYKNLSIGDLWLFIDKTVSPYVTRVYMLSALYNRTATWIQLSTGLNELKDLTGNAGGAVGSDILQNINILGTGSVTVTGNPATNTLTISGGSGITSWTEVVGTTQAMAVNSGYIANNVALVTCTLPAISAVGDQIKVALKGTGGVLIAQNAGDTIHFGNTDTTPGVGGSIASSANYDSVSLLCTVVSGEWMVLSSVGNWTIV